MQVKKTIVIKSKDNNTLLLFIATLKDVAKDMDIKVVFDG
jgi:hypothetical protein